MGLCIPYRVQTGVEIERLGWGEESEPFLTLQLNKEVEGAIVVSVSDQTFSPNPEIDLMWRERERERERETTNKGEFR